MAKCGETLIRQFENALNSEKPLRILDFEYLTVKSFFNFVEHQVIDVSEISYELTILSHLYGVLPLFRICEKHLAETLIFKQSNVDTWINFANIYNSIRLTQAIYNCFYHWKTQSKPILEKWQDIIGKNEDFLKMVGIISFGFDECPLFRYKILDSKGIYLFPLE